jgi:hypothetical protein
LVRSAKACDLARRLARRENRSIADIVGRALEACEIRDAGREPAPASYAAHKRILHRHRSRSRHPRTSRERSGTEALIFLDTDGVPETLRKAPNTMVRISAGRHGPARAGKGTG